MSATLTVGIMGAGRMAQGFDAPGDGPVLSLAHAVSRSRELTLGGFFDKHVERAAVAERRWQCPGSPRERSAWLDAGWDVIVIATPDEQHAADLRDAIARKPRAILVEKPLATSPDDATALLQQAISHDVPVLVDFPRRFHSGTAEVARRVKTGLLGRPFAASFIYSGSATHSAVHMLDLFACWWGRNWDVRHLACHAETTILNFQRDDSAISGTFVSMPSDGPYVWDMTVYCERGKIALLHSPEILEIFEPGPHPHYAGYDVLCSCARFAMEEEPLLSRLVEAIVRAATVPEEGTKATEREMAVQEFSGAVLRILGDRPVTGLLGGAMSC